MAEPSARLRSGLALAAPALALLAGVVLLSLPLRLFQGALPTPVLPLLVVFLYALYDPGALPAPVIFAGGLLHDLLTGAALGPWASVYLLVAVMIGAQRTYFLGRARDVVWVGFAGVSVAAMIVYWAEMSLLKGGFLPLRPAAYQFLVTVLSYPLAARAFFWLRARVGVREAWEA